MKFFITGGTGFIGEGLINRLLNEGKEVVALCRSDKGLMEKEGLAWKKGSLEDADSLIRAMEGCTHVFHCAGLARLWDPDTEAFFRVNVKGTENILAAASYHDVEKLVYTSTAGVLGRSLSSPISEEDPRLEPFDNDYDLTKYLAEERVREYAAGGRQAVIVSPSRVYGPGTLSQSNSVTKTLVNYIRQNFYLVPGNGAPRSNYVFVDDVVEGHMLAMQKGAPGEKFTLGGENLSYNELYEQFKMVTGLERRRISIPAGAITLGAYTMMGWTRISGRPPVITPWFAKRLFHDRMLSIEKAESVLGYRATPMKEALSRTLEFLGYEPVKT